MMPEPPSGYDDLFQKFLESCDSNKEPSTSSAKTYQSTVDRFNMSGLQSQKQKTKSKYKQRVLQRNAGYIKAGQIQGNVGNQSVDDLLRYINGDKVEAVATDNRKVSLKIVKDSIRNDVRSKSRSEAMSETTQNSLNSLVSCEKTGEKCLANSVESEGGVYMIDSESESGNMPNGFTSSEEESDVPKVVANADTFDNAPSEFESKNTEKSSSESKPDVCADKRLENSVAGVDIESAATDDVKLLGQKKDFVDAVELSFDTVETIEHSKGEDNHLEQTDKFITVQKKKRNRFTQAAENKTRRDSSVSLNIETRSKTPIYDERKTNGIPLKLTYAKSEKSKYTSFNRGYFHQPWSDVYRSKNRRGSELTLKSSGSENSSTCSAPILKTVTSCFASNAIDVKCKETKNAEVISHSELDKTNSAFVSRNCDPADNRPNAGIGKDKSGSPVAMEIRLPKNCDADSKQVIESAKICSKNSSVNADSSQPVIFLDTRKKKHMQSSPTEKCDISFGFHPADLTASKFDGSDDLYDRAEVPIATDDQISYLPDLQYASGFCNYCGANQVYEYVLKNGSYVISLPNHMCPAVASQLPFAYSALNSFPGSQYALPVTIPVGIVPSFGYYNYEQVNSMSSDFSVFESVHNEMVSPSKLTDGSISGVATVPEFDAEPLKYRTEAYSANVDAQVDSAFSKSKGKRDNIFNIAVAQKFLHSQFEDVISDCIQFNPDEE